MDTSFDMDSFDESWDFGSDEFHMPYASNAPSRYREAYGNYSGGYGPGPGAAGVPPLLGYPIPRPPPPPPRGPPLGFGPIIGPGGPPRMRGIDEARAAQFMTRCGMTREALRHIPKDMLLLMEPQRCGLCCIDLNSFPLARVHYMSKNHAIIQKKWLSQSDRAGYKKEAPLKSRDLYCELCDIQITSKSHGDSHYSGKNHLAVVEGRKQPKNPSLLARGATNRLNQLIRREKKALEKKSEAVGEEGGQSAAPKKEVKPSNSKYYCDICKTTLLCQEQMMAHLNGKRHLSREKNHILRVMRGEENAEDNDNGGDIKDGGDNKDNGDRQSATGNGEDAPMKQDNDPNNEWSESWDDVQTAGQ